MRRDEKQEAELWKEYDHARSEASRRRLLDHYLPVVRSIAGRMYRARIDDTLSLNDYLQYGHVGLLEAVNRFDWRRHASFGAFSSHRIRGSILNGLVRESEQAAQHRFWRKRNEQRMISLCTALAPEADRASLADIATITAGLVVGALLDDDGHDGPEPMDRNPLNDPYAATEIRELCNRAKRLLTALPDKERIVIHGHYVEGIDFELLAARLALSKGRVSQIHAQALLRLRDWMSGGPRVDKRV